LVALIGVFDVVRPTVPVIPASVTEPSGALLLPAALLAAAEASALPHSGPLAGKVISSRQGARTQTKQINETSLEVVDQPQKLA
jgi:hypothetical protein